MRHLRILQLLPALDGGGIDKIIFDYSLMLLNDGHYVDFVVSTTNEGYLENTLIKRGCIVYHITRMSQNLRKHCNELELILRNKKYDIVHDNSSYKSFFNLKVAKKCGVDYRIAHSHSAMITIKGREKLAKCILSFFTKKIATDLFSCGEKAEEWTWGKNKSFILPNSIKVESFAYDSNLRFKYINEFGLNNNKIVGIIARLSEEKNHLFLLDVIKKVVEIRNDVVLIVVGSGELNDILRKRAKTLDISKNVIFTGLRNDVSKLINLFDLFVLPSKYEGVPVTILEAQANGLPCLLSDTITKEVCVNENIHYLSLNNSIEDWKNKIISLLEEKRSNNNLSNSKYNIENGYQLLIKKYMEKY